MQKQHWFTILGLGLLVGATQPASAAPPACRLWAVPVSPCEVLGKPAGCTAVGVEQEQVRTGQNARLATVACKKFLKYSSTFAATGGWKGAWELIQIDDTTARCVWDQDGDGDLSNNETTSSVVLSETPRTPDPHCFCTVTNGPHASVPWDGQMTFGEAFAAGFMHIFPKGLKKAILQENVDTYGALTSDAAFDPNNALQKDDIYAENAAEIDHIIPRVDSQGCLCGDVTPDNAAVISREMNQKMSNISPSWSLERSKMYEQFGVQCESPGVGEYQGPPQPQIEILPIDLGKDQVDESAHGLELANERSVRRDAAPPETGGCSTGGGSGALAVSVAALALVRRRRRTA